MNTNIDLDRMREFQERVRTWQRDVADQPVTTDPALADMDFLANQAGFVWDEWSNEFRVHFDAYLHHARSVLSGGGVISESEALYGIADDIGDTAFTLMGLLNAAGYQVEHDDRQRVRRGIVDTILLIDADVDRLTAPPTPEFAAIASRALWNLKDLAGRLGIGFFSALRAVCDSNDTKLWTDEEFQAQGLQPGLVAEHVRNGGKRCWRVKRVKDGKLIKSPSFQEPDLREAVSGYTVLTDA